MLLTQSSSAFGDQTLRPDLSSSQRWLLVAGAVLVHGVLAILVWHSTSLPALPPEAPAIMVSLITNDVVQVAPPTPPVPEPPKPVMPKPLVAPPKVQPTVLASNRAPAPQDMQVPAAPEPPAPAPPAPVPAAQPTAAVNAAPEPTTPQPPKVLPSSAVGILVAPKPIYPPASLELGEAGTVTMMLLIDDQGRIKDIQVTKSSGYPRLDRAAVAAERVARFKPYMEAGVARSVYVPHSITFNLEER